MTQRGFEPPPRPFLSVRRLTRVVAFLKAHPQVTLYHDDAGVPCFDMRGTALYADWAHREGMIDDTVWRCLHARVRQYEVLVTS